MVDAYFLSEQEKTLLQGIINRVRSIPVNLGKRDRDDEVGESPEVYIARPQTSDGIPALETGVYVSPTTGTGTGDTYDKPGVADCDIYRIIEIDGSPYLQQVESLSKSVYNVSTSNIPQEWTPVIRTKFGNWLAVVAELPEGTRTNDILRWQEGQGWVIHAAPEDVGTGTGTVNSTVYILSINGGVMQWITTAEFVCPTDTTGTG